MPGTVTLGPQLGKLETVKRQGWLTNDVYALQNLMESFLEFKPLTPQLSAIGIPTMILNGEFDFLTPLRDAVSAAVESHHLQVRKPWDEMLAGIGVERSKAA
jgi:pimeloyl-ACP methyl ester carboxylesterase